MIEPKDKKELYGEMIYVYKKGSFNLDLVRLEASKRYILDTMDKDG